MKFLVIFQKVIRLQNTWSFRKNESPFQEIILLEKLRLKNLSLVDQTHSTFKTCFRSESGGRFKPVSKLMCENWICKEVQMRCNFQFKIGKLESNFLILHWCLPTNQFEKMLFITTLGFNFRSMLFFFGRLALRALLIWNDFRKRNYASKLRWSFIVAKMLWLFQQLDCLHLVLRMLCSKILWNSKKTYNLELFQGRHNFIAVLILRLSTAQIIEAIQIRSR